MTQKATELCAASGIAYRAEFVPQSKSRNADKPEPCLNWRFPRLLSTWKSY